MFQVQGKGTGSRRSQEHTKIGLPSGLDVDVDALFLAQRPPDQINHRERTTVHKIVDST